MEYPELPTSAEAPRPLEAPMRARPLVVGMGVLLVATLVVAYIALRRSSAPLSDRISIQRVPVPYHRSASMIPLLQRIDLEPRPVLAGSATTLTCVATIVGGEPNSYRWLGPFGETAETASASATWIPAAPETASVTCIARNSMGSAQASIDVQVLAAR